MIVFVSRERCNVSNSHAIYKMSRWQSNKTDCLWYSQVVYLSWKSGGISIQETWITSRSNKFDTSINSTSNNQFHHHITKRHSKHLMEVYCQNVHYQRLHLRMCSKMKCHIICITILLVQFGKNHCSQGQILLIRLQQYMRLYQLFIKYLKKMQWCMIVWISKIYFLPRCCM